MCVDCPLSIAGWSYACIVIHVAEDMHTEPMEIWLGQHYVRFETNSTELWILSSFAQVAFEGRPSAGRSDDIAIDDITILPYPCPAPAACDFESGLCSYTNVKGTDQFDWTRGFGSTTSAFTGPSVDHTTNSVQGEFLCVGNHPSILLVVCTQILKWFWGEGVLVVVFLGGLGGAWVYLFTSWWLGRGGLFPLGEDGQVFFWVGGWVGGVLVCFSLGRDLLVCFSFGLMTRDSVVHVNISDLNKYQLAIGIWQQNMTSMVRAHVCAFVYSGHYMFIESSSNRAGDKAQLQSEILNPTTGSCLVFYYNMNGAGKKTFLFFMPPNGASFVFCLDCHEQVWVCYSVGLTVHCAVTLMLVYLQLLLVPKQNIVVRVMVAFICSSHWDAKFSRWSFSITWESLTPAASSVKVSVIGLYNTKAVKIGDLEWCDLHPPKSSVYRLVQY